jgi:signal transduction histidine kinase
VTVSQDGSVWAATEGAALYQLHAGAWRHFDVSDGLTNYYIWSVAEDAPHNLWVGTWGGGLYEKHGDVFRLAEDFDPVSPPITAIFCEAPGSLWLGTAQGLFHYENGRGTLYAQAQSVRTVLKDHFGAIWFGMSGGGLGCLQQGVIHHFGKADGLLSDFVECLHEDGSGAVWVGTFGGGLSRCKAGKISTISSRQGLADNVICDIEDDGLDYYWMSSYNGILRVLKTSLDQCADGLTNAIRCDTYGISDGMPTLECSGGSQPSGCHSANGLLWFATSRGLVTVHPADVKHNPFPPPVMIEKVIVDDKLISDELIAGGRIEIPPGQHRLEFQYTGLSFAAPEKVRFQHRLDGLDAGWIDAGTERRVDYNYIPPGDYVFHVIACNNDGVWSDPGATLSVTMLPYFWQTAWFLRSALLGLLLLVGGGSWYGTRLRMSRKLERLERQRVVERERTRIARDIHDDLGASLTRINLLSQSAQMDIEDTRQHLIDLDQISTTARKLTRAMDEIVWAVDPKHDTLESLVSYLAIVVREMFADSQIRYRLDFPRRLPAWPLTAEVRHNLFLAFKEALHNVLKHSGATEVNISFVFKKELFKVVITDNGCGFDPAQVVPAHGRHNGLVNMRQRLEEINGSCEIQSGAQEGTTVKLIVPIKNGSK